MKEMVLYYAPKAMPHVPKLKGVLVRMGIRIKNISPDQVMEKVGYLAGLPGFGTGASVVRASNVKTPATETQILKTPNPKTPNLEAPGAETPDGRILNPPLPLIEEEMLVMKNFTSRRIDELLTNLRKSGVPKIALKAVITEKNSQWTFYELYKELKQEHASMAAPAFPDSLESPSPPAAVVPVAAPSPAPSVTAGGKE